MTTDHERIERAALVDDLTALVAQGSTDPYATMAARARVRAVLDKHAADAAPDLGAMLERLEVWSILIDPHFDSDGRQKGYRTTFVADGDDKEPAVVASGIGLTRMAAIAEAKAKEQEAGDE